MININRKSLYAVILLIFSLLTIAGCNNSNNNPTNNNPGGTSPGGASFTIVAGSECKALQPLFDQFQREHNVGLNVQYSGSIDISSQLENASTATGDAYMPSNSLWITLGDTHKQVKDIKSIARTYVVFGIKKSVASRLGWIGKQVTVADILKATKAGNIRYMMTSATQSNSGASAYFGYLYAFAGHPEMLTINDLNKPQVRTNIKAILSTVNRSAGSSGFLKDLFLQKYEDFDGMVNYESVIIDTNKELVQQGKEPLYVIYPVDGLSIADYPLGYVDHGDANKQKIFQDLQTFLLSQQAQQQIAGLGWRTSPIGMQVQNADPAIFNPDWGIDTKRVFTPIRLPESKVIAQALNLYQTAFRKPSLTIYCLDYSGSMAQNGGEEGLKSGMRQILDPDQAKLLYLQAAPGDITVVIPFNQGNIAEWQVKGNNPDQLRGLLSNIMGLNAEGSTNYYNALARAYHIIQNTPNVESYSPAIVLMTDGQDNQGKRPDYVEAKNNMGKAGDIPIYAITYGDADLSQLNPIAQETSGKIFDGKQNLKSTLREVKGYN